MAYRNVDANVGGFQTAIVVAANSVNYSYGNYTGTTIFTTGTNLLDLPITENAPYTLFDNNIFKITAQYIDISNKEFDIKAYYNNEQILYISNWGYYMDTYMGIAFGVDDETELGAIYLVASYPREFDNYYSVSQDNPSQSTREKMYLAITSTETPSYSWETVQSISGKLGTVNLARIKDDYINDGEPVSGAAKSRFSNLKDGSKVSVLIENVLPDPAASGTDVTVKYDVPSLSSGSYAYCKLVVKKNSMPESVEDGNKIIDLDPTKASITVKYLSGNTKYYFEIFTQDSEGHEAVSNVKSITTGEAYDIILFTDEFNEDILVDNWNITVYESGWGNGSSLWNPSTFHSDFLTAYNFLIGNASRRSIWPEDGDIIAPNATSMTDGTFWIPIKRSTVPETFKIEFDAKVDPQGSSDVGYNYAWVAVGCVDSSNNWHQCVYTGGVPGRDWVHYETEITDWTYGYIDYIGLSYCDGKPHFKNVKITV